MAALLGERPEGGASAPTAPAEEGGAAGV